MVTGFLPSFEGIDWTSNRTGADCEVYLGQGEGNVLEIVVTETDGRPRKDFMQNTYTDRRNQRVSPVLVVAVYGDGNASVCGPSGEDPIYYKDLDSGQVGRVCKAAIEEPNRHAAERFLAESLPQLDEELPGIRNQGLLSTHELRVGVPDRDDWNSATSKAQDALADDPRELIQGLNYEVERLTDQSYILKHSDKGNESAVAVFLRENESFEHAQDRFVGDSPVAYALDQAEKKNLDYVIGNDGDTLRLYTTNPEDGFGSRGQTDTYVEINTGLLADEKAGYLWLLFSADALQEGGSLREIMERSKDYAADLGARLRERIYDDVVPDLAEAIADARNLENPTKEELDQTYEMALVLLYRLLFIAYTEDEEFLPRRRNAQYDSRSLKRKARNLHQTVQEGREFEESLTTHWDDVMTLCRAIHNGHSEWGLPAYNGRLLSEDPEWSEAGAQLADIQLTDDQFGPVLVNLLIDETEDGFQGPVDFRNIGVREFGVVYEGLLESELSVAEQDLTIEVNDGDEQYVPAGEDDEVAVEKSEIYLHGQSGERKATGTYYTKTRFVEHLLDYSLEPALDDHIDRINRLREEEGDSAAAEAFFDIRVADIAMGSGHFLVGAIDRIEKRLREYLTDNSLPGVEKELDNLEDAALSAFEDDEYTPSIERGQLLRRQVARRCVYGVDLNPLATELARLSLWVHTFVPGLPLTFLDYNLVTGDSLSGIGTLDEVSDILGESRGGNYSLTSFAGEDVMDDIHSDLEELGSFADTSAEKVAEARKTRKEINEALRPIEARFDILAASRIDDDVNAKAASQTDTDPTTLKSYELAQDLLESTDPLHFPVAFPEVFMESGGFDVIVGNPPWEEATLEEKEFWARYIPGFQGKSEGEQEKARDELLEKRPELMEKFEDEKQQKRKLAEILKSGPYEGSSAGGSAPEMYISFAWRFHQLIERSGYVGAVLPRGAFSGDNTTEFREKLFETTTITDLTFLVNRNGWVFDSLHGQRTVALCSLQKTEKPTVNIPICGPFYDLEGYKKGMEQDPHIFDIESIREMTSSLVVPLPPSTEAVGAFSQMISNNKSFDYDDGGWKAVPVTPLKLAEYEDEIMDDGTRLLFRSDEPPEEDFLPVAGGKCLDFWSFDVSKASVWTDPDLIFDYLYDKRKSSYEYAGSRSPFSEMPENWIYDQSTLPCYSCRIAFRDSTNKTNRRTVVPALIPPNIILLDTAPYLIWPKGSRRDQAYLLGIMASIPFDWCARRFVEGHVSFYLLRGLPVPRTSPNNPLHERVIEISGELSATDERYSEWADAVGVECAPVDEGKKQKMVHELDAVVAHLYGLTRANLQVIFETFHDNWDHEPRMNAVLEYYDEWAEKLDLDHSSGTEGDEQDG